MRLLDIGIASPVFIRVDYRPPDVSLVHDTKFVDNLKLYFGGDYETRIIMGDFNANLLTTSVDETYLRDGTNELTSEVVEHGAKYFTTARGRWIDTISVDCDKVVAEIDRPPIITLTTSSR